MIGSRHDHHRITLLEIRQRICRQMTQHLLQIAATRACSPVHSPTIARVCATARPLLRR